MAITPQTLLSRDMDVPEVLAQFVRLFRCVRPRGTLPGPGEGQVELERYLTLAASGASIEGRELARGWLLIASLYVLPRLAELAADRGAVTDPELRAGLLSLRDSWCTMIETSAARLRARESVESPETR